MMYGRHILSSNVRAHFGFAPHQLAGVLQAHTDKPVFLVKPHSLPIVPSHLVWRVSASAPVSATGKLSTSSPAKIKLPDIKWSAAPLPEIKDVTEVPASLKRFTHSSRKHALTSIGATYLTNTNDGTVGKNQVPHPVYNHDVIEEIPQTQHKPRQIHEYVAGVGVKTLRLGFDLLSGFRGPGGVMTVQDWLNRCLLLETVASVPVMVASMARHVNSLRSLDSENGWMLETAENERMHLLIFMNMKRPGRSFRVAVLVAQGIFVPTFLLTYLVSPRTCHRFVHFLEEEAVKTYTNLLEDMEHGHLDEWCTMPAPLIGRSYYNLPGDAKVYDMIKCIRADEANHHHVNTFAGFDHKIVVNRCVDQH